MRDQRKVTEICYKLNGKWQEDTSALSEQFTAKEFDPRPLPFPDENVYSSTIPLTVSATAVPNEMWWLVLSEKSTTNAAHVPRHVPVSINQTSNLKI